MFFCRYKGSSFLLYSLLLFLLLLVFLSFFILVKQIWHVISCSSNNTTTYQIRCISSSCVCHHRNESRHLLYLGYFVFVCFFSRIKEYIMLKFLKVKSIFLPFQTIYLPEMNSSFVLIRKTKSWLVIT